MADANRITQEDVLDAAIQALEHDFPTAAVFRVPGCDRIVFIHKDMAPEVIAVDFQLAELTPVA